MGSKIYRRFLNSGPLIAAITLAALYLNFSFASSPSWASKPGEEKIALPKPMLSGKKSLEETLATRRSVRSYSVQALSLEQLSQLLWAAQGVTSEQGFRTAPSAGALYPLEVYAVVGRVEGLGVGVYKYLPSEHRLQKVQSGDQREALAKAALSQSPVRDAAVDLVITAVYERTMRKYGERGRRYVHIEVGHVGQNICLQATAFGLGACTVGAFSDEQVKKTLALPTEEEPLYILSVGHRPD